LFGVGGAIVIIPGLVLLTGLDQLTANGHVARRSALPVGILGALEYYRRGQVNVAYAAIHRGRPGSSGRCSGPSSGRAVGGALGGFRRLPAARLGKFLLW